MLLELGMLEWIDITWDDLDYAVQPLVNGHPWGNGYWPLRGGWPFNRGKNNRKALIRTFTTGCIIGVAI